MPITVERWDDPSSWNQFVSTSPHTHFQQSWEWGELAPQLGGAAVRLAALEDGQIGAAMQVFVNPIRGGDDTHLYVPRGPAMNSPRLPLLASLMDAARALGQEKAAVGLRIEPNVCAGDAVWEQQLDHLGFRPVYPPSQPRSSWMLDISPDPDELLGNMKSKTRYNIRLATRKGVSVEAGTPADLDTFYDLYKETALRDDFFVQPLSLYSRMFELFGQAGRFCLLLARHEGMPIAAVTLITQGSTCWYMHGASSNRHRNLMATYLLQWRAISWAKERGCTLYDFRAVPDVLREDQDMFGVYRFKEGFGGYHHTVMHTYSQTYRPGIHGLWQLYFSGRFALTQRQRRRKGLPIRQFA